MALSTQYRHDVTTAWLDVAPGVQVKCSHLDMRSPEYLAVLMRITKPVRKMIEHNALPPAKDRELAAKAFIEHCVKDWRTVVGPEKFRPEVELQPGEWLAFTPDNVEKAFADFPQFYLDTLDMARDLGNFQLTEATRKNSETA